MKFKRIFSITLIVALILSIASINTAMASNTVPTLASQNSQSSVGYDENVKIKVGHSKQLIMGMSDITKWTTSNKNIVQVSSTGIITGINAGKATVTATNKYKFSRKYNVVVTKSNDSQSTIGYDEKLSIKAGKSVTPSMGMDNIKKWTSSNTKIAKVNKKGVVIALQKGKTTITAINKNGFSRSCVLTVTTSPKLSKTNIVVNKGKCANIKILGKAKLINNKYTNSKSAKIISSSKTSNLKVKGIRKGKSTLKIKVNGVKSINLSVTVK